MLVHAAKFGIAIRISVSLLTLICYSIKWLVTAD